MITYTEEQVKEIIEMILKKHVNIRPVGNHELMRHLVYHLTDDKGMSLIFKLYFKKNRWNREVATLSLLSGSSVKCPRLIDYGILNDGTEWLMIQHMQGEPFEKVKCQIPIENQKNILRQMGAELGKIHNYKGFGFFGNWDQSGNSQLNISEYKAAFIRSAEIVINQLLGQDLPEMELFKKGAVKLRKEYSIISSVKEAHLCHNDFDARNVLVAKYNDSWELTAVIDFEQSFPWDKDKDIVNLYYDFCSNNKYYEKALLEGYSEYSSLGKTFYEKKDFYLLFNGLSICSWAYIQAPEHYIEGVKLLRDLLY